MNKPETLDADGPRCWWSVTTPDYVQYHDLEWGRPVTDRARLFEKLCLEGFQAGLSWLTILRKREAFRSGFSSFVPEVVAQFGPADVERLLSDPGIVRHRAKVESVINNARRLPELEAEVGPLPAWLWREWADAAEGPAVGVSFSSASTQLSKRLKSAGFSFVGPTTVYAFMQAMGLVNDHDVDCFARPACQAERLAVIDRLANS